MNGSAPERRGWVWFAGGGLVLFSVGLLGSLIFETDPATLHGIVMPALQFFISPWMIAAHLLTAFFLLGGYLVLRRGAAKKGENAQSAQKSAESALHQQAVLLGLLVASFALGLAALGGYFGWGLYEGTVRDSLASMRTISRLRAQQVDKWIFERSVGTGMLASALAQMPLDDWKTSREVRAGVELLISDHLSRSEERMNVTLFSATGEELAVLGADLPLWQDRLDALDDDPARATVRIDSRVGTEGGAPAAVLSFTVPILRPADRQRIGVLRLVVDPVPTLLAQVRRWPTREYTGEILVVTRRGEDAVSLTPSRFASAAQPATIEMRRDLADATSPGALAIVKGDGMREAIDYRGMRVVSASTSVRGVPWFVVAKLDRDEALAPLGRKFLIMALSIATAIVLAGLMVMIVWRGQRASFVAFYKGGGADRPAQVRQTLQRTTRLLLHASSREEALRDVCRELMAGGAYRQAEIEGPGMAAFAREEGAVSFPIEVDGRAVATLAVKAPRPHTLDAEELSLLAALADDLGYTLARLADGKGPSPRPG